VFILVDAENILGFEISVSYSLGVKKLQCGGNIFDNSSGLLLCEILPETREELYFWF